MNPIDISNARNGVRPGVKFTMEHVRAHSKEIARLAGIDGEVMCSHGDPLRGPCTVEWVDADGNEHELELPEWASPWPLRRR